MSFSAPSSRARVRLAEDSKPPLAFRQRRVAPFESLDEPFDRDIDVRLCLDSNGHKTVDGRPIFPPALAGMSGAPIWRVFQARWSAKPQRRRSMRLSPPIQWYRLGSRRSEPVTGMKVLLSSGERWRGLRVDLADVTGPGELAEDSPARATSQLPSARWSV